MQRLTRQLMTLSQDWEKGTDNWNPGATQGSLSFT
jgi:hypothetical protein